MCTQTNFNLIKARRRAKQFASGLHEHLHAQETLYILFKFCAID